MQMIATRLLPITLGCLLLFGACSPSGSGSSPAAYSGGLVAAIISGETFHLFTIDSALDAVAEFTTTPGGSMPAFVDSVTMNGMTLDVDGDSVGYIGSNQARALNLAGGVLWHVKGANGISSFTFNDTHPFPEYRSLPDTLAKSTGYTFILNSSIAPATDSIVLEYEGGPGPSLIKRSTSGGISLSPAEVAAMGPDSTVMVLHAYAHTDQIFGGQRFAFVKGRIYYKTYYIK